MSDTIFGLILNVAGFYLGLGFCMAAIFVTLFAKRFDPAAAHGTWGFRLLIIPGVMALWPVILFKMLALRRGRGVEGDAERPVSPGSLRRTHALAFVALLIAGTLLFAIALIWRAPRLEDAPPVDAAKVVNQTSTRRVGEGPQH